MQIRTFVAIAGFSLQVATGAAVMIWPEQTWVAILLFSLSLGLLLLAFFCWFFANYRLVFPIIKKRKNILKCLQQFYISGETLQMRPVQSDVDFAKYKEDFARWFYSILNWVEENMSQAALVRFRDLSNVLPMTQPHQFSVEHRNYINTITKYRDNLKSLIESDKWDK